MTTSSTPSHQISEQHLLGPAVEQARYDRGAKVLAAVDGEGGQNVVDALADIAPALAHQVVAYAFGDVYARPGLTHPRQLVTLGMLTALGGCEAQLEAFFVASIMLRASRKGDLAAGESGDLSAAIAKTEANKGKSSSVLGSLTVSDGPNPPAASTAGTATAVLERPLRKIVFACDAGMGSSVMGASVLRDKMKKAGVTGVTVVNLAVADLHDDADLVISQVQLTDRAKLKAPSSRHVSVDNFMNSPVYDDVVQEAKAGQQSEGSQR